MRQKNNAIEILEYYKKLVWPEVQKYLKEPIFPDIYKIPSNYKSISKLHWDMVFDYPRRMGKYLRATLLILTAKAIGIADHKKLLKTAAAMQISEDWLLIHDDIEDQSILRRGKPALQKIYGSELSINAGDALH